MLYHLSLCNDFARFLETEWQKVNIQHRGLTDDSEAVQVAENRKTAIQKQILLERMLGLIQFSRSSYEHNRNRSATFNSSKASFTRSTTNKHCSVCKLSGQRYQGHVNDCWYLSKIEKLEMAKALQVTVEHDDV